MQQASTQIPLRCSSPANSEAQPDHSRKVDLKRQKPETQSVASVEWASRKAPVHADSPKRTWKKGQHMEEISQSTSKVNGLSPICKRRSVVKSNIKDEEEKEEPSQQGIQWTS